MAINKKQSPVWVKATLIVLIVAFVASFITIAADPFSGSPSANQTGTLDASLAAVDAQFQPQVASLTGQLQSDPSNYDVLVRLGNTYFDWANAKQQASQNSTAAVGADQPFWISAKDAYSRALAIKATESPVRVDHAITVFYSGDTGNAIVLAEGVIKDDPKFAPAHLNLGIFYETAGQTAKALAAFEKYLELDPSGTNVEFANTRIAELKKAGTSQGATGSAPTTITTP